MAPFGLLTGSVSLLARSFSLLSCTGSLARRTSLLPVASVGIVRCFQSQADGPPKRPANGFVRYHVEQAPVVASRNPEITVNQRMSMIAQQWREMSAEEKKPFMEAYLRDMEQFKVDLKNYQAQLTPQQIQQHALEKKQKQDKRKARRKRKELSDLGKPKGPRNAINIYIIDHYVRTEGNTALEKMKKLFEGWKSLSSEEKQVYVQLAEDDKVRHRNEMRLWETHMLEIGREDVIRGKTLSTFLKTVAKKKVKLLKAESKKRKIRSLPPSIMT
ncbi:transcription factor A, mitochondrial [Cynoglossus semilaevis]|uniref:Transcription factor A, mitochondrial n=1 Tax=Cynoglossus semilaevis TaxID=244447 RepID=A0A097RN09_CYNSE|nr:transcription factor A, mitochondrial [Cynoglossus semilaevis]AIU80152.1 mitochondrial transcription factor A [Cynoglossus semilaevis]